VEFRPVRVPRPKDMRVLIAPFVTEFLKPIFGILERHGPVNFFIVSHIKLASLELITCL
jgi:hypothetical protein